MLMKNPFKFQMAMVFVIEKRFGIVSKELTRIINVQAQLGDRTVDDGRKTEQSYAL